MGDGHGDRIVMGEGHGDRMVMGGGHGDRIVVVPMGRPWHEGGHVSDS